MSCAKPAAKHDERHSLLAKSGSIMCCADIKSNVQNAECFQSVLLMGPRLMGR